VPEGPGTTHDREPLVVVGGSVRADGARVEATAARIPLADDRRRETHHGAAKHVHNSPVQAKLLLASGDGPQELVVSIGVPMSDVEGVQEERLTMGEVLVAARRAHDDLLPLAVVAVRSHQPHDVPWLSRVGKRMDGVLDRRESVDLGSQVEDGLNGMVADPSTVLVGAAEIVLGDAIEADRDPGSAMAGSVLLHVGQVVPAFKVRHRNRKSPLRSLEVAADGAVGEQGELGVLAMTSSTPLVVLSTNPDDLGVVDLAVVVQRPQLRISEGTQRRSREDGSAMGESSRRKVFAEGIGAQLSLEITTQSRTDTFRTI